MYQMNRLRIYGLLKRGVFTSNHELFRQQKKANLEQMVAMLKREVPNTLSVQLPFESIAKDVILRICPARLPHVPVVKTNTLYLSVVKILSVIIRNFILNSRVKLHIQDVKVLESRGLTETEFTEADSEITLNKDRPGTVGLFETSTKVVVKWRTCVDGCSHLHTFRTVDSEMGSFRISNLNLYDLFLSHGVTAPQKEQGTLNIERVLCGVFVFELSENNDTIKVHTIDDVELVESETDDKDIDEMKNIKGVY